MYIPQSIVEQFYAIEGSEGRQLGMKLTLELVRRMREQNRFPVNGIYIIPPAGMNWKHKRIAVQEIIQMYRESTRAHLGVETPFTGSGSLGATTSSTMCPIRQGREPSLAFSENGT